MAPQGCEGVSFQFSEARGPRTCRAAGGRGLGCAGGEEGCGQMWARVEVVRRCMSILPVAHLEKMRVPHSRPLQ